MYLNKKAENNNTITKDLILKVHNLVSGKHLTYKNSYRKDQNVVADSITGTIVYIPPEAKDVEILIKQMIKEFNSKDRDDIPIPIKAGILAYEFVTIHPFWDENSYLRQEKTYFQNCYIY